ncbi:helix-turn-helix domain-containing protein [Cellulosimicrobium sp. PMB13]|uniref:helix-turn-helix domain-containing protein n=1 Tax=Cellulosimicrobium sp. PMB13 TaxID=3120158 RepID=UPI003F4BD1EB
MAPVRDNADPLPQPAGTATADALLVALSPAMVALMDELPDTMFCAKDVTGRYVAVNPVFVARTTERSRRAVLGRRAGDLFVPQLAERYEQQDAEVLRTGRPLRGELERIRRLGGTSGWFLTAKLPVHDDAGRLVGLVSVSHDLRAGAADDETMASLSALVAAVEADLGARWTTARLADAAGCTPATLERRVRRVYGVTPRQLVLRTRVDRATRLLAAREGTIAEVAAASGFYDQPSFTRTFARLTGETPAQYRRRTAR